MLGNRAPLIFKKKVNSLISKYTGRPRILYPGRIELFYFFWALRPGYYVQQCIFFSTIPGPFSHNLDQDIDPRSRFFEFFFDFL
jgi:hypothetical protein